MTSTVSYKIRKGDTLPKIAKRHFIADWKKEIWLASFNKDLRSKTKSPNYVQAGWVIQLPVVSVRSGELYQTVGAGKSFNRPEDVVMVKGMLNKHATYAGFKASAVNGKSDRAFVDAIKNFQKSAGLPVTGTVAPKDKTLSALSKAPSKKPLGKTVYKFGGKEYQADAKDVKTANKKVSKRMLEITGHYDDRLKDLTGECDKITKGWSDGAPFIRAALRISRKSHLMREPYKKIAKGRSELKKLRSLANSTESASLKKAMEQRIVAQKAVNKAGEAFTQMLRASGSSLQGWIDVLTFTRDSSFGIIETYLAVVTKNPPLAGAAVGGVKQGIEELANASIFNATWDRQGGVNGAVCRVVAKSVEGGVFGKLGSWVGDAAAPFASKMGTWIAKSGLLKSVIRSQSKTIYELILKKYSAEILTQYPKLAQKDIADWMLEKAIEITWNAKAPDVASYWMDWLKSYHYKLCDMVIKSEMDFAAAMNRAEKDARTPQAAKPLIEQHIKKNRDQIAKLVVEELKAAKR